MPTQTGTPVLGLVNPFIMGLGRVSGEPHQVTEPLPTQTTAQTTGLVVPPFLIDTSRTDAGNDRSYALADKPLPTQTTHQDKGLVIPPFLVGNYTPGTYYPLDKPMGTVTTQDHHSLIVPPFIVEMRNNSFVRGVEEPLSTVCTSGSHHGLVMADSFFMSYYGKDECHSSLEPLGTVTTKDRHALIELGPSIKVEDCYFRMLQPTEIGRAMAFPDSYVVLGTSREKVKQYGNAVTPPVLQLIMERCLETLN
jgi:DNA (cytosine-5)-methyltransferase 1